MQPSPRTAPSSCFPCQQWRLNLRAAALPCCVHFPPQSSAAATVEPFLKAGCNAGGCNWELHCWGPVMLRGKSLPHVAHLELEECSCPVGLVAELRGTEDVLWGELCCSGLSRSMQWWSSKSPNPSWGCRPKQWPLGFGLGRDAHCSSPSRTVHFLLWALPCVMFSSVHGWMAASCGPGRIPGLELLSLPLVTPGAATFGATLTAVHHQSREGTGETPVGWQGGLGHRGDKGARMLRGLTLDPGVFKQRAGLHICI